MTSRISKILSSGLILTTLSFFGYGLAKAQSTTPGASGSGMALKAGASVSPAAVPPAGNPPEGAAPGSSDQQRHPTQAAPGVMPKESLTPRDVPARDASKQMSSVARKLPMPSKDHPVRKIYREGPATFDPSKKMLEGMRSEDERQRVFPTNILLWHAAVTDESGKRGLFSVDADVETRAGQQDCRGSVVGFGPNGVNEVVVWNVKGTPDESRLTISDSALAVLRADQRDALLISMSRVCQAVMNRQMPLAVDRDTLAQHYGKRAMDVGPKVQ